MTLDLHTYLHDDSIPARLDEVEYKHLMAEIDPNVEIGGRTPKLPFRDWSKLIPSVNYVGYKRNTLKFFVPNKYNGWETYFQFDEWMDQMQDRSITAPEAARLLLWSGNIRIHCGCPSFKYYGFQYILTQLDAAIVPEERYPHIRNPHLRGVVCKHANRSLKVLPFHLGDMAKAIKEQRLRLKTGEPDPDMPEIRRDNT
jgi:hypothetical protein